MAAALKVEKNKLVQENELIEKARSGDTTAYSALVEFYQERAVHAAYSFVGNLEDARDLAQEAFMKAYECLGSFKSESRFYTWLYRILINGCKDFLRKKQIRRVFSFCFGKDGEELDPLARVPDPAPGAQNAAQNRELGAAVSAALETLPFRQKSVFVLRYLEGLELKEISESLEISVGAVKAHLWQAAQKMRVLLKDYTQEET